jgi:hypothetical protein
VIERCYESIKYEHLSRREIGDGLALAQDRGQLPDGRQPRPSPRGDRVRHPNGIAASDKAIYPVWTDGRNSAFNQTGIGETDIFTNVERK